jgi:subtilisin family serine protease
MFLLLGLLVSFVNGPASGGAAVDWRSKVDAQVLEDVSADTGEFILFLDEQADLSGAERLRTKAEKGRFVYEQLSAVASRTQGALLEMLRAHARENPGQVEFQPFWVANMIWVRGDQQALETLARQPEVRAVYANPQVRTDLPELSPEAPAAAERLDAIPWGLEKVGAPEVWALGVTGQGVVIGGQDTGYAWQHPALRNKYRGWNGTAANHSYNWHDAIHSGFNACPPDSPAPCDDGYHGTHTMGTMVGDDGSGSQIGMAPGARWIGCRNMRDGFGSPRTSA